MNPINYDFGKNWDSIKHHIDNPIIQKAIRKGLKGFIGKRRLNLRTRVPASYTSSDAYATIKLEQENNYIQMLRDTNQLPAWFLKIDPDDDYKYFRGFEKLCSHIRDIRHIKYNLESYVVFHSCHYWNPTFGLQLARLVMPEETWIVRRSDKHTTVINKEHTKVFDILYWACSGRLDNYLFSTAIKEDSSEDPTLGGKDAYNDSGKE